MTNNRCWGLTRNLHRCSRTGDWKIFCGDHKRQWIGWSFTLIFTVLGGAASIYGVLPSLFEKSEPYVSIPSGTNLDRAISMAKMEGVAFKASSATDVVAKFFVRPTVTFPINDDLAVFALVSVSPFKPKDSDSTFDAGDCRFLGHVTSFDPFSHKAILSVKTISCTDNSNKAFTLENDANEQIPLGLLASLSSPTEMNLILTKEQDGTYSAPMFSNALIKFVRPIDKLKIVGTASERF